MNYLDLFSGIGGFALGAYWSGARFDRHYYSEVDDYAGRIYQQRFPDSIALGDIRGIKGSDLPEGEWVITGGFPCQDISFAGKGAGLAGERSGLWFEYARLIGELRPRVAIMENVGALAFRGLDAVLGSLSEIGYDAEWQDIRASDVGAPHRRERIWIVAYPEGERLKERGIYLRSRESCSTKTDPYGEGEDVPNSDSQRCKKFFDGKPIRKRNVDGEDGRIGGNWLFESDVGRVAPRIPHGMDRLKCLGNSIVPQIAELIFKELIKAGMITG